MEFYTSECVGDKPSEIDTTSSKTTVYIRKDFTVIEETEERPSGWQYQESKLTRAEYAQYLSDKAASITDYNIMIGNLEDPEEALI